MVKLIKQIEAPMQLAVINQNTAAIDAGSMLMMASFTDANGNRCLIETNGFTESITELAKTFKQASVTHVDMEATGVYRMALYQVPEAHGLTVTLINPRHFKNLSASAGYYTTAKKAIHSTAYIVSSRL